MLIPSLFCCVEIAVMVASLHFCLPLSSHTLGTLLEHGSSQTLLVINIYNNSIVLSFLLRFLLHDRQMLLLNILAWRSFSFPI